MPTIVQRHKDRLATLSGSLTLTGATTGKVPFGTLNNDGSFDTSANLTFDTVGNVFAVGGTINSSVLNNSGLATLGGLIVSGTSLLNGNTTINGSLQVGGNQTLVGTLTAGTTPVAVTNSAGFVNVTALSAGPVGTWLTTGNNGIVNWNNIPNIAAGWTFDGTKIFSNAGIPVRVNSLSAGTEKFNVGGTSIFQSTVSITNGGLSVVGSATFNNGATVSGTLTANGAISVSNGVGTAGQALFTNGSNAAYWSFTGGGFVRGTNIVDYPPGTYPDYSGLQIGPENLYTLHPLVVGNGTSTTTCDSDFVIDNNHGHGNSRMYINYSTRAFTGNESGTAALNVVDSGGGAINCGISAGPGIRIISTPPGYSGPALGGGMALFQSNSPSTNSYAFIECENPDTVPVTGPQVQRFAVYSNGAAFFQGSVQIGDGGHTSALAVQGAILGGGLNISGSKHFSIPHPLPELADKKKLHHISVECPRPDLIYRGKTTLVSGRMTIDLDIVNGMTSGTIVLLADMANADVFLTNRSGSAPLRGSVSGSQLLITCESEPNADVSWLVIAERLSRTLPNEPYGPDGHVLIERDIESEPVTRLPV